MKKVILSVFLVVAFMATTSAQLYIGATKKEVISTLKPNAEKIERPEKSPDGSYTIGVQFEDGYGTFSFTKENICNYFIVGGKYTVDDFKSMCNGFDEKFSRVENTKRMIWQDYDLKFDEYIYYWVLVDHENELFFLITIKQSDYEIYDKAIIKSILG